MGSSSGNSTTSSTQIQNSGSENDLNNMIQIDERKRKRMQSNRESARRSRMRKQKHVDELKEKVDQLRRENNQILHTVNVTTQQCVNVEAENSVLRAQMGELSQRLQSLNEIIVYMNTLNGVSSFEEDNLGFLASGMGDFGIFNGYNDCWTMGLLNHQSIMPSPDVLHC